MHVVDIVHIFAMFIGFLFSFPNTGEHIELGFPSTVPSGKIDQIATTGLYNTDTTLDIRSVVQSTSIRLFIDCNAIFHLLHHRDASKNSCDRHKIL